MACGCTGATVYDCGTCSMECLNEGDSCGVMGCGTCSSGGGNSYCFVAGTKVTMADGTEKNIEEIEIGDEVKSWNAITKEFESNKVISLKSPIHDDMVILKWEHAEVKSTFDHPFWSVVDMDWASYKPELTKERYEFCNVGQLIVGSKGLFLDGDEVIESELISIEEDMGEVQTYIFGLDNNNTFFANGIATHNKTGGGGGGGSTPGQAPSKDPVPFGTNPGNTGPIKRNPCQRGYTMINGVCKSRISNPIRSFNKRKPQRNILPGGNNYGLDSWNCGWGGCCNRDSDCHTGSWKCIGGKCRLAVVEVGQINRKGGSVKRNKYASGGSMGSCPPGQHMMPDGTCMMGDTHPTGGYRRGGPNRIGQGMNTPMDMGPPCQSDMDCPFPFVCNGSFCYYHRFGPGGGSGGGGFGGPKGQMRKGGRVKPRRRRR